MKALQAASVLALFLVAGCQQDGGQLETANVGLQGGPKVVAQWEIPYGPGESALGLRRASTESRAWGPQSATLSSSGELAILDNEKGRIVTFDARGDVVGMSPLSPLTMDLACSNAGCWFLELAGPTITERAEVHGARRGARPLSAAFKTAVALTTSGGKPTLLTVHQESYDLSAQQPLADRRSGFLQADGRALSLTLDKLTGSMTLHEELEPLLEGASRRTREVYSCATTCDAVRLIGTVRPQRLVVLCDAVDASGEVLRRVQLLGVAGTVLQSVQLATDSLYVPFRQVRLVGDSVLLLEPRPEYLQATLVSFDGAEGNHE